MFYYYIEHFSDLPACFSFFSCECIFKKLFFQHTEIYTQNRLLFDIITAKIEAFVLYTGKLFNVLFMEVCCQWIEFVLNVVLYWYWEPHPFNTSSQFFCHLLFLLSTFENSQPKIDFFELFWSEGRSIMGMGANC